MSNSSLGLRCKKKMVVIMIKNDNRITILHRVLACNCMVENTARKNRNGKNGKSYAP